MAALLSAASAGGLLATLLPGLAGGLLGAATPVGRLDVSVDHLRSARGSVLVCLTADPDNFPNCVDDARAVTRTVPVGLPGRSPSGGSAGTLSFEGLPLRDYAVAVIHDENGNGRLDTLAGIPREGYGFSRNPPVTFGPPRFAAARFAVTGDAQVQQVRMRYIF